MISHSRLTQILSYNPELGVFSYTDKAFHKNRRNVIAGSLNKGRVRLSINGRVYAAHRVAWFYMTGLWPKQHIDHINGDPSDNRWRNLRIASPHQNMANRRKSKNNTSGFKGVTFHKQQGKWQAQIQFLGECRYLGLFETPHEAHSAYVRAAKDLFGTYARFE